MACGGFATSFVRTGSGNELRTQHTRHFFRRISYAQIRDEVLRDDRPGARLVSFPMIAPKINWGLGQM